MTAISGSLDQLAASSDALLNCLHRIALIFSLPFNAKTVTGGLSLEGGKLTPDGFVDAANRLGLKSQKVSVKPSRVSPLVAPFCVLLKDGQACVVEKLDWRTGTAHIAVPASDGFIERNVAYSQLDAVSAGVVFYTTPQDKSGEEPGFTGDEDTLAATGFFWRVVTAYWPSWLMVVITAFVVNMLGLATPLFIMNVYDRVIPNLAIPTLWALSSGVVIALIFDGILKQLRNTLLDRTGQRVDMRVGASVFRHVLGIRMDQLPGGAGKLANTVREFESVRDFFTSSSLIAITDFLFIGIFLAVLALIVGPLAWVPAAAVPLILLLTILVKIPLSRSLQDTMQQVGQRQSLLVESLNNIEAIRTVGAEGKRQREWERAVSASASSASRSRFWSNIATNSTQLIMQSVSIVIIVWGVFLVVEGEITVGALIAANILAGRVLTPLGNIAQTIARSSQAFQAMRGISGLMALPREDQDKESISGATPGQCMIEFQSVGFSYQGASSAALEAISMTIKPGETVGLIGAIGSGKSTIGKLLGGIYEADQGNILIDGLDIRTYDRPALRSAIAYCSQEVRIFSGTIRDNIALGADHASDEDVSFAAELCGVNSFAKLLPEGLGAVLEEQGVNLSGGQRQAISLARNLVRKPQVIFLDEPTSAMDSSSEARYLSGLMNFANSKRTLIIASHKASVHAHVDRLIVLDRGRMIASGPAREVLTRLAQAANAQKRPDKEKTDVESRNE